MSQAAKRPGLKSTVSAALQQVGRADPLVMDGRATKIVDAGLAGILEGTHCRWIDALADRQHIGGDHFGYLAVGCIVCSSHCILDLGSDCLGHLVGHIAVLWARQRCRKLLGKTSSTARIRPGGPAPRRW